MRAVVLALIWTLTVGCAATPVPTQGTTVPYTGPPPPVKKEGISYTRLEQSAGVAFWDCDMAYPSAWVRLHIWGYNVAFLNEAGELMHTQEFAETIAHELEHVRSAYEMGCEAFNAAVEDTAALQRMEQEAECEAWRQVRRQPCG
jgi:hypothetical protein